MNIFKGNQDEAVQLPGEKSSAHTSNVTYDDAFKELVTDYVRGRRTAQKWKIAIVLIIVLYVISNTFINSFDTVTTTTKAHIALVELEGPIIADDMGASADQIIAGLRQAFAAKMSKAVFLKINSPGGSPVQSADINSEMQALRKLYPNKPLYVIMSDIAASGGYYVAVGAEKIYANPSSIVGSIGVRMDGFGFVDFMKKYGIERRSLTAGGNKSILDPFSPMTPAHKQHVEKMLQQVHQQFINVVKQGRRDKLADNPEIFSGLFWSGEEALRLGLIDDFGNVESVAKKEFSLSEIVDYSYKPDIWEQALNDFGVSIGNGIGQIFFHKSSRSELR